MRYLNAVVAVLALFFAVTWFFPDILVLLLFVTGGLAFPLLFLNTVLLYLRVAWPVLFLLRKAPRNWPAIGLAALLVPFTAFASPFLADRLATQQAERLLADDVRNEFVESPRSVEIVALSSSAADTRTDTPCSALCQRLLLSGQVVSIGRQLVPHLLAYLRARPVADEYRDNFELAERAALTALGRFGHFGEAREIFLSHHRKFGEDYLRRYARVVNSPDACYL